MGCALPPAVVSPAMPLETKAHVPGLLDPLPVRRLAGRTFGPEPDPPLSLGCIAKGEPRFRRAFPSFSTEEFDLKPIFALAALAAATLAAPVFAQEAPGGHYDCQTRQVPGPNKSDTTSRAIGRAHV